MIFRNRIARQIFFCRLIGPVQQRLDLGSLRLIQRGRLADILHRQNADADVGKQRPKRIVDYKLLHIYSFPPNGLT